MKREWMEGMGDESRSHSGAGSNRPLDAIEPARLSSLPQPATTPLRLIPPGSGPATRRGTFFLGRREPERAVLFVDGNNWFHSLRQAGVGDLPRLDYAKISRKLVRDRAWIGTRYYIGRVPQRGNLRLYRDQRRFLASLESTDPRISIHLGRIEFRAFEIAVEKAVDVMLAVDLVLMAERREFESAYLLSADGDFTPAVDAVRSSGRKVFAVSASHGGRLREACNAFIRVDPGWFEDCYRRDSRP